MNPLPIRNKIKHRGTEAQRFSPRNFYKFFLTLFIFILSTGVIAQTVTQNITIADGANTSPDAGSIISRLASGNGKGIRSTNFSIRFDQVLKQVSSESKLIYEISGDALKLSGDISYKGIDVSNYLVPDELKFILKLSGTNNYSKEISKTTGIHNAKPETVQLSIEDSVKGRVSAVIINHQFYFHSSIISEFRNRADYIDNYYNSSTDLGKGIMQLKRIHPEEIDLYKQTAKSLDEATAQLETADKYNFIGSLNLSSKDPAGFKKNRDEFSKILIDKKNLYNKVLTTIHLAFYDRAMGLLQMGNPGLASDYLRSSLEANPEFAPALLQLGIIDLRKQDLHAAEIKAHDVLHNMHPDPDTRRRTFQLLNDIYESHLDIANNYFTKQNYRAALEEYSQANELCRDYEEVKCTTEMLNGIINSKKGIYNSYLNEARKYVQQNNFGPAETSVQKAIEFQNANSTELKDDHEAQELMRAIKQKRYNNSIHSAENYLQQNKHDDALATLDNASALAEQYQLTISPSADSLTKIAAGYKANILIAAAEEDIRNNKLNSAKEDIRTAAEFATKYKLNSVKDINFRLEKVKQSLYTQQCQNAQQRINGFYVNGKAAASQSSYLTAQSEYDKALEVIKENKDCALETDSLFASINYIEPAVTYLSMMNNFNASVKQSAYEISLGLYSKISEHFISKNVNSLGINHETDTYRYLESKADNGLVKFAADKYTSGGEFEKALVLYKLLVNRKYERRKVNTSLYNLGLQLGKRDVISNAGGDYKILVKQYSSHEKGLKQLTKGYKKGWKS